MASPSKPKSAPDEDEPQGTGDQAPDEAPAEDTADVESAGEAAALGESASPLDRTAVLNAAGHAAAINEKELPTPEAKAAMEQDPPPHVSLIGTKEDGVWICPVDGSTTPSSETTCPTCGFKATFK